MFKIWIPIQLYLEDKKYHETLLLELQIPLLNDKIVNSKNIKMFTLNNSIDS